MSHPIATTVTLVTADPDGIAQSQSKGSAGALTLNGALVSGGVATMDAPRRIAVNAAGNNSGITFTIVGTARSQQGSISQTETITGPGAGLTVYTTQDFATVTSVSVSAATTGAVIVGTNGIGSGPWVPWDLDRTPFSVSAAGFVMSGSPTWQLDITYDDVFLTWLPSDVPFPRAIRYGALANLTTDEDGQLTNPVRASRLTLTAVGSVQLVQQQARG